MRCDRGAACVRPDADAEPRDHTFSGWGFHLRFHAACCPGWEDGMTCRRDHPDGWRPEHSNDDEEQDEDDL